MTKVVGLVLAAGESRRMGRIKQLLPFGESTILGQVVKNSLESNLAEIIVVLGYGAQEIARTISATPVKIVVNPDFSQGLSSSLKRGLREIAETSAVMILLGDQPLIDKEIINRLIAEFTTGNRGIVVPVHKGKRGHPVIFAAKYRSELLALEGDVGGKEIVRAHPDDVTEVEIGSEAVICDIDNNSDYLQLRMDYDKENQG